MAPHGGGGPSPIRASRISWSAAGRSGGGSPGRRCPTEKSPSCFFPCRGGPREAPPWPSHLPVASGSASSFCPPDEDLGPKHRETALARIPLHVVGGKCPVDRPTRAKASFTTSSALSGRS